MTMQNVISWLRSVENLASAVYSTAARVENLDHDLSVLLHRLAEDEAWHYHMMGSAAELFREEDHAPESVILVDSETRSRVEQPLSELRTKLLEHRAGQKDILDAIVQSETSEWNDIFLYVIATCIQMSPVFQYLAATIQAHEYRIEEYLKTVSSNPELRETLSSLPRIWSNRLLVVEDDPAVSQLFKRVLSRYGEVTTVENGEQALEALKATFFNVIVTDVDMPVIDGLTLLNRATKIDSRYAAHFVVCTGHATEAIWNVTESYGVPLLQKPVTVAALRETIETILRNAL